MVTNGGSDITGDIDRELIESPDIDTPTDIHFDSTFSEERRVKFCEALKNINKKYHQTLKHLAEW